MVNNINTGITKIAKNRGLSESETKILLFIAENIETVNKIGVRGVAKENFTSTSTIMRLAKKLGYSGFTELQYYLNSLLKNKDGGEIGHSDYMENLRLNNLLRKDNANSVQQVVRYLHSQNDKMIFIYANGFSGIIAEYLYKKLLVLGKQCVFSNGSDSCSVFNNNLKNISCIMVISKSGETRMVLDKVQVAKEENIQIVSFTNIHENSIAKLSDIEFGIEDANGLDDGNLLPSTFFPKVLALIELIVHEYHKKK